MMFALLRQATNGLFCLFSLLFLHAAVSASDELHRLKQLSLEELAELEVSIASKRPEKLTDTAAAVFVITQEDIRRSGATEIPELLRMVPGLHVARGESNEWSVSSRGFADRFSNKLLVLLDGRSIYSPLFSGVIWEAQGTLLEDIERIEVIRGPGAAVWGANAVNGVINIITKPADATQGGLLSGIAGDEQRGVSGRFGGKLGDNSHYRVYATYHKRDAAVTPDSRDSSDDWEGQRAGFRVDWQPNKRDAMSLQGDIYREDADDPDLAGGNVLARWQRTHADTAVSSLQAYYDRTQLDLSLLDETRDTLDIEFQHQMALQGPHSIIWGLGYRVSQDTIDGTFAASPADERRTDQLFSAFFQDDIGLIQDKLYLTLGSKLEHNDYTGFEIQPNARLRWLLQPNQTLWAAVSRAVRTPSRFEHDITINSLLVSPSPATDNLPVIRRTVGNDDFVAEELIAYELGYRWRFGQRFSLDLAAFYNDYEQLRSLEVAPGPPRPEPLSMPQALVVPVWVDNQLQGETYGFEMAADWQVRDGWRLQAAYSWLNIHLQRVGGSTDDTAELIEGSSPEQQFSLRSTMNWGRNVEFDLWTRYVDELPSLGVDDYLTLDARLAWRPWNNLELSLVGRNLLDKQQREFFDPQLDTMPQEIEREFYLELEWRF